MRHDLRSALPPGATGPCGSTTGENASATAIQEDPVGGMSVHTGREAATISHMPVLSRSTFSLLVHADYSSDNVWRLMSDEPQQENADGCRDDAGLKRWGINSTLNVAKTERDDFAAAAGEGGVFRGFS
jgi:hypothetical protein